MALDLGRQVGRLNLLNFALADPDWKWFRTARDKGDQTGDYRPGKEVNHEQVL